MSDEDKDRYIIQYCRSPHPGSIRPTQDHHIGSHRTDLSGEGQTDKTKDLPNTYSRSTAETIMNPIGHNVLVICLHFETTTNNPAVSKLGRFERRQTCTFLTIFFSLYGNYHPDSNSQYCISYRGGNMYFMTTVSISQRLLAESRSTCRFKIYRKPFRTLTTSYRS